MLIVTYKTKIGLDDVYDIRYSPGLIFYGKIPGLDINFIEPIKVNTNIFLTDLSNIAGGKDFYLVYQELLKINEKMISLVSPLMDNIMINGYKGIYSC